MLCTNTSIMYCAVLRQTVVLSVLYCAALCCSVLFCRAAVYMQNVALFSRLLRDLGPRGQYLAWPRQFGVEQAEPMNPSPFLV